MGFLLVCLSVCLITLDMPNLPQHLSLTRCPHCQIDNPNLDALTALIVTNDQSNIVSRAWKLYKCTRCGGVVLAGGVGGPAVLPSEIYPRPSQVDASLPAIAKEYLSQAINSVHSPAGAVMLCASSVDAMLKDKGYVEGSLFTRINRAAQDHLITEGMKEWAHEIRLDANDQRHADQAVVLPTTADAQKNIEFAQALGQFLFALPARVAQGRATTQASSSSTPVSTPKASPSITQADIPKT